MVADLPDAEEILIPLTGRGPAHAVLANVLGDAAQVRAAWGHLESKYDALFSYNPCATGPADRLVLLTRLRLYLRTGLEVREVTGLSVTRFQLVNQRAVEWHFSQQGHRWTLRLQLLASHGIQMTFEMLTPPGEDTELFLRPDLEARSFHGVSTSNNALEHAIQPYHAGFTFSPSAEISLSVEAPGTEFRCEPEWHNQVYLPQEAERGLECRTDVFSPGAFVWHPHRLPKITLQAAVGNVQPETAADWPTELALPAAMQRAMDLFLAKRDGEWTVIAGYPWFLDWGRDSLIFVRGLIAMGRLAEAKSILRRFAAWEYGGSLPNILRGTDASNRETSDAPLWLVVALRDLHQREPGVMDERAGQRSFRAIVNDLLTAHASKTHHGVRLDAASGLLWSPAHYTWMDTDNPAATPRQGYPICIQSLWIAALEFGQTLFPAAAWAPLAQKARDSVERYFWLADKGYYGDCLHAEPGQTAAEGAADGLLRPNQLLAITLGVVRDKARCESVLKATECLLVPGALRTLGPQFAGYKARYTGPEQTHRKAAYHNGTAWPWLMPMLAESLVLTHGDAAKPIARKLLGTTADLLQDGCLGQVAEVIDAEPPHRLRGCNAQAWSVSEWVRVWAWITSAP